MTNYVKYKKSESLLVRVFFYGGKRSDFVPFPNITKRSKLPVKLVLDWV